MHHHSSCSCPSRVAAQSMQEMDFERSLHNACVQNDLDRVRKLLQRTPVDQLDGSGYTPLSYASFHGHIDIVEYLIEQGAHVNHCTPSGRSCLWRAIKGRRWPIVKLLLVKGADPSLIQDQNGKYPWTDDDPDLERLWRVML